MVNPKKTNSDASGFFKKPSLSAFKSICCLAGTFVVLGLATSPLYAMPTQIDKKHKIDLVKKKKEKKGKKMQKASNKIKMDILKDGYR